MKEIDELKERTINNYGKKEIYLISKSGQLLHSRSIKKRNIADFVFEVVKITKDIKLISDLIIEILLKVTENNEKVLSCIQNKSRINIASSVLRSSNFYVDKNQKIIHIATNLQLTISEDIPFVTDKSGLTFHLIKMIKKTDALTA